MKNFPLPCGPLVSSRLGAFILVILCVLAQTTFARFVQKKNFFFFFFFPDPSFVPAAIQIGTATLLCFVRPACASADALPACTSIIVPLTYPAGVFRRIPNHI